MKKIVVVVAVSILTSGCALFSGSTNTEIIQLDNTGKDHPANQGVLINYDVGTRGAFMIDKSKLRNREITFCAEPSPDAAVNRDQKITSKGGSGLLSLFFGENGGDGSSNITNDEFEGRSQSVLMLREALYRLCEMSANHSDLTKDELIKLYDKVLDTIPNIAKEEANAVATVAATEKGKIEKEKQAKDAQPKAADK